MGLFKLGRLTLCGINLFAASVHAAPNHVDYAPSLIQKTLVLTWGWGAPNGNRRQLVYTNGQFPGPPLIFDEGDDIEVTVINRLPFNITVHWHGLEMQGTPWSDGVPGLSQKPIEPGQTFIRQFKASPSGTYWYHSHTRATMLDGLHGALYIRPKNGSPTLWSDISSNSKDLSAISKAVHDPTFLVVSDWSKLSSWEYLDAEEKADLDIFCRDSILINGKGSVFCPGLDYLKPLVAPQLAAILDGQTINDKGCLPFVPGIEGPYLPGHPEVIPPGMQEGCVSSNGSVEIINVDQNNGWVSLNLVMAATFMSAIISIDNHNMWIYEVDGQLVEPQQAQGINMYPGERYAVLIKLDQQPGEYAIRVADSQGQLIATYGSLRYKGSPQSSIKPGTIPSTPGYLTYGGSPTDNSTIIDGGHTHFLPFPPLAPARQSDAMHVFSLGRYAAPWRWTFSGNAIMPADASAYDPLLYSPNNSLALNSNLTIRTTNGSWVDLVLQVGARPGEPQEANHAIHKHASKTWLIGQGIGIWNYSSVADAMATEPRSFNLENPTYRDTFMTSHEGSAWIVLRYQVTSPGAWLLHCHVETHLAGGMGVAILDGVDRWPDIPPEYAMDRRGLSV